MSALGQPPAQPAADPAAGGTTPPAQQPQAQPSAPGQDPYGFAAALQNIPEALRPNVQPVFDQLAPQLDQRFQPYQQLQPFMEQLTPLLEADAEGNTTLGGLIGLYELFDQVGDPNDPNYDPDSDTADQLMDWWESVGEQFGFFGEEGPPAGAAAAQDGNVDLAALPPEMQAVVGPLVQQIEGLKSQLGEFTNAQQQTAQQQAADRHAQQIRDDLSTRMKVANIEGWDDIKSPAAQDILRLAVSYGEAEDAIEQAVNAFMRMTGHQAPPPTAADPSLSGVAALQAALNPGGAPPQAAAPAGPGPALGNGSAPSGPEHVTSWEDAKRLATQRLVASTSG